MAWLTRFRAEDDAEPHWVWFFLTLNYRLNDGSTLHIEQQAAWCEQCRRFGSAELVSSIDELRDWLEELQNPTQSIHFALPSADAIQGAIDEVQVRLRWFQTRKSPARCLTCGSTAITPIRFGEDGTCVVNGKRLIALEQGFADSQNWIAEYSSEGIAISKG